jgi:hypothetical protein
MLIKTIQGFTGATIDHYAEVNLLGFAEITEAVGGVDVCLLAATKDSFSGANFPAGPQTLSGPPALAFVRQRHELPNGDLDRVVRQQVFMKGMATKVLGAGTLTDQNKLNKLLAAIKKSIVLDQRWNIVDFARQMSGMSGGSLDFRTIPTGNPALKTSEDGDAIEVRPSEVKAFTQSLLGSAGGTGAPSSSVPSNSPNAGVTVDVRNGNGANGLAGKVSKSLADQGFKAGETSNVAARSKTVVRYPKGDKDNADKVAEALGGSITVEQDANVTKGHVVVFIGKDYKGPTSSLAAEPLLSLDPHPQAQPPGTQIGPNGAPCVH